MDKEKEKHTRQKYYLNNKQKFLTYHQKYFQINKLRIYKKARERRKNDSEKVRQWDKLYREQNREKISEYRRLHRQFQRKVALVMIDPKLKCVRCGCDDIRFLEINHKNGGGGREQKQRNDRSLEPILIIKNKRKTDDLELLCRPCNHIHFLELKYGLTGLKVVWEKPS